MPVTEVGAPGEPVEYEYEYEYEYEIVIEPSPELSG
jgi:hypothetical protein